MQASPRAVALATPAAVSAIRNETSTQGPPDVDAGMTWEGNCWVTAPTATPMTRAAMTPRATRTAWPAFSGAAATLSEPSEICAVDTSVSTFCPSCR